MSVPRAVINPAAHHSHCLPLLWHFCQAASNLPHSRPILKNASEEEGIVRKIWLSLFLSGLGAVLWLNGCARQERPSVAAPSPSASRAAAKPKSTPVQGDLVIATENLNLAIKEFHNRNNRGALEFIEIARAEMAAAVAHATDKAKPKLEAAAKNLDSVKTMIEQNDKKADKSLTDLIDKIGKLAETQ